MTNREQESNDIELRVYKYSDTSSLDSDTELPIRSTMHTRDATPNQASTSTVELSSSIPTKEKPNNAPLILEIGENGDFVTKHFQPRSWYKLTVVWLYFVFVAFCLVFCGSLLYMCIIKIVAKNAAKKLAENKALSIKPSE